jgi:hypothetical protein
VGAHSTNYIDAFIAVSDDCPAECGTTPPEKAPPTVAALVYRQVREHPYAFTSDDVIFDAFAERSGIARGEREEARRRFFSKGQACLRASALGKTYGWGIHSDPEGRIALYGVETPEYERCKSDPALAQLKAMKRSKG